MEYTFQTDYNRKALTAMAKGVRKVMRRKKSRLVHIAAVFVAALGIWYIVDDILNDYPFGLGSVITILAVLAVLAILFLEDPLNGYLAGKRLLPGTKCSTTVFDDKGYTVRNDAGETRKGYDTITGLGETGDYLLLFYSRNHVSAAYLPSLSGGTSEEFRRFIEEKAGYSIQKI